jgi:hypothetical protein
VVQSLTLDSQQPNGATACPATLFIQNGGSLTVETFVNVLQFSKVALNGSSISCSLFTLQSGAALSGSGTITASDHVYFAPQSLVLPGTYQPISCQQCWPNWSSLPSQYGDLHFVAPWVRADALTTLYFKDLSTMAQMSTRTKPGVPYDTISFSQLFICNGTNVQFLHSNNSGPLGVNGITGLVKTAFLWGSNPVLMTWGSISLLQPFVRLNQDASKRLVQCGLGFENHLPTPPNAPFPFGQLRLH